MKSPDAPPDLVLVWQNWQEAEGLSPLPSPSCHGTGSREEVRPPETSLPTILGGWRIRVALRRAQALMLVNRELQNTTFSKQKQHCPKQRRCPVVQTGVFNIGGYGCPHQSATESVKTWCKLRHDFRQFCVRVQYDWGHTSDRRKMKNSRNKANLNRDGSGEN